MIFSINPEAYGPDVMNLATYNLDYQRLLPIVRKNIERTPNLKIALIEADFTMLLMNAEVNREALGVEGLAELGYEYHGTWRDWIFHFDKTLRYFIAPYLRWRLTPAALEKNRATGKGTIHDLESQHAGYIAAEIPFNPSQTGKKWVEGQIQFLNPENLNANVGALNDLITLLMARDIKVVLMRYPRFPGSLKFIPQDWLKLSDDAIETVRNSHGPTPLEFWDLGPLAPFDNSDYFDGDHINTHGAEKLHKALAPKLAALKSAELK